MFALQKTQSIDDSFEKLPSEKKSEETINTYFKDQTILIRKMNIERTNSLKDQVYLFCLVLFCFGILFWFRGGGVVGFF